MGGFTRYMLTFLLAMLRGKRRKAAILHAAIYSPEAKNERDR